MCLCIRRLLFYGSALWFLVSSPNCGIRSGAHQTHFCKPRTCLLVTAYCQPLLTRERDIHRTTKGVFSRLCQRCRASARALSRILTHTHTCAERPGRTDTGTGGAYRVPRAALRVHHCGLTPCCAGDVLILEVRRACAARVCGARVRRAAATHTSVRRRRPPTVVRVRPLAPL